jgi:hypothetical protein
MQQDENIIEFLFSMARETIHMRASRDGYAPEEYDAGNDPEGYCTSLLTALRHWCHAHGIDWDNELQRSGACFREDMGVPDTPAAPAAMACPVCGHRGSFHVEVTEVLLMFADGVVLSDGNTDRWDNDSWCSCPACAHAARVMHFRTDLPMAKEAAHG